MFFYIKSLDFIIIKAHPLFILLNLCWVLANSTSTAYTWHFNFSLSSLASILVYFFLQKPRLRYNSALAIYFYFLVSFGFGLKHDFSQKRYPRIPISLCPWLICGFYYFKFLVLFSLLSFSNYNFFWSLSYN